MCASHIGLARDVVQPLQQTLPILKAADIDGRRHHQIRRHLKRGGGIGRHGTGLERIEGHAEEVCSRVADAVAELPLVRNTDIRRQAGSAGAAQLRDERADRRLIVAVLRGDVGSRKVVAGQHPVDRRLMTGRPVMHAAEDVEPVGPRRQSGQVFADAIPRQRRRDGIELAPVLARRGGLHVPCVELRAAPLQQDDDRPLGRCCLVGRQRR